MFVASLLHFQAVYVVLLAVASLAAFLIWDSVKPKKFPPGPPWLPILGNYRYYNRKRSILGYHHLVWQELHKIYGPIVGLRLGNTLIVTVSGAKAIREVLFRDEFEGRPDGYLFRMRTFGKRLGIVFSDGPHWQKQRKFSLQHLRNFGFGRREMEVNIIEETRDFVTSLKANAGTPVNMHHAFDVGVLNVLWSMMAGTRFALDDEKLIELIAIIHDAFQILDMSGGLLNQMPYLRHVAPDLCNYTQLLGILKRMWKFLEETISEHKNTVSKLHTRDLIDAFLHKMHIGNEEDGTFTDEQLLSLLLDLFMAGSETTSNTLEFSMWYMLRHPGVQKNVQGEMDAMVGRNRWPTLEDRIRLPYTEAVLMEIQRMANVPPLGIAHRSTRPAVLFGYHIPKGTTVLTNLYSVHMDETYWKDPKVFRPERFIDDDGKINTHEKYFLPFGNGKRRCLGESLAKANYFLFFTAILHSFDVRPVPGTKMSMDVYDGITLSPKPFQAVFTWRDD